jgi:hypothetical protein
MMLNLCATLEGRGRKKESWEKRDGEDQRLKEKKQ